MRPLRYSINVTLDACCDHRAMLPDEELHRHAAEGIARADALLLGRVTYELMEDGWRPFAQTGVRPDWMESWMDDFARTIDAAKKYVVSSTLDRVDWNAELLRGDLADAVRRLKQEPGRGLAVGGVTLPLALAELGLIDEYEFVVQPKLAGHGRTLFAGLSKPLELRLVDRREFTSGAVALRYEPRRSRYLADTTGRRTGLPRRREWKGPAPAAVIAERANSRRSRSRERSLRLAAPAVALGRAPDTTRGRTTCPLIRSSGWINGRNAPTRMRGAPPPPSLTTR
jgi:dihydrofolate reductase